MNSPVLGNTLQAFLMNRFGLTADPNPYYDQLDCFIRQAFSVGGEDFTLLSTEVIASDKLITAVKDYYEGQNLVVEVLPLNRSHFMGFRIFCGSVRSSNLKKVVGLTNSTNRDLRVAVSVHNAESVQAAISAAHLLRMGRWLNSSFLEMKD